MAGESDSNGRSSSPPALDRFGMPIRDGGGESRRSSRAAGAASRSGGKAAFSPETGGVSDVDQQTILYGMFATLLIGITVFQKIGYVPNKAVVIPLILPLIFAVFGVGLLFARPIFRPERAILYLVVVITSAMSNILFANEYSLPSMMLYFVLYLPFLVAFDTTQETYRRCLSLFSTTMLVFAAIVWMQHAVQFTVGWTYWPNLDKLLPKVLLVPEFNYIQPIQYGMNYMKPSGICFLEVSTLSQFITLALIIELIYLQRLSRAIFFGATLFATFAGTGLFLLIVALPIVFTRMNTRTFVIVLATVFIALFVALQLHWFDLVADRVGEFQRSGSSANSRFIEPLDRIRRALIDQRGVYSGVGSGQIEAGGSTFWWPVVKTTVEYGLIQGILFYVFYLFSLFDHAPSRRLAFVIAIWFSFEGTLLTPYNPIACVMLSTMFMIREETGQRRRSRPPKGAGTDVATATQ